MANKGKRRQYAAERDRFGKTAARKGKRRLNKSRKAAKAKGAIIMPSRRFPSPRAGRKGGRNHR